jgi:hypothetical protein
MSATMIIFIPTLIVFGYVMLRYRLMVLSQPLREDLARRGERLIANPALPQKHRDHVEFWLNTTFRTWWMPVIAVLFPIIAIFALIFQQFRIDVADQIENQDVRREYILVRGMSMTSDFLLSPLSAAVILPQAVVLTTLFFPITRIMAAAEHLHIELLGKGPPLRNQAAH